jgi:hypothetical protein
MVHLNFARVAADNVVRSNDQPVASRDDRGDLAEIHGALPKLASSGADRAPWEEVSCCETFRLTLITPHL